MCRTTHYRAIALQANVSENYQRRETQQAIPVTFCNSEWEEDSDRSQLERETFLFIGNCVSVDFQASMAQRVSWQKVCLRRNLIVALFLKDVITKSVATVKPNSVSVWDLPLLWSLSRKDSSLSSLLSPSTLTPVGVEISSQQKRWRHIGGHFDNRSLDVWLVSWV